MEQPKVFEFAKEVGIETLVLMDKIREWKLPVKSHMAALDESLIEEIRKRLDQETAPSGSKLGKKPKTARKKVASQQAGSAPGESSESAVKSGKVLVKSALKGPAQSPIKSRAKKPVAHPIQPGLTKTPQKLQVEAEIVVDGSLEKKATSPSRVIRRKAGEAEAKAALEAEAAAEAARVALAQQAAREEALRIAQEAEEFSATEESPSVGIESLTEREVGSGDNVVRSQGLTPGEVSVDRPKPRRNIIGRMDLNRVSDMNRSSGSAASSSGSTAPGAARPSRTAPRNIRTGFVAPMPLVGMMPDRRSAEDLEAYRLKEEKEKALNKKRPGSATREEEVVHFAATEFRKREVVFQPKKKKVVTARDVRKTQITIPKASKRLVKVFGTIKVSELADQLQVKTSALITKLAKEGVVASHLMELDFDTVALIAPEFGYEAQNSYVSSNDRLNAAAFGDLDAELCLRPPVVTVMGHVDHGKTTLLDSIRKANVAKGEAGGITQHIGAYSVQLEDGSFITFLDTPGHEAFTAMRARGANVTDVAIIVVAADDGLMPQTAEAINHAKAAKVPIIVAVNKMDKAGANPDRIKQQLTEFELVPEEWGGETIYAPVSALTGAGIPELLSQIRVVAEVADLKANPQRSARGVVIESRIERGRGSVATLLIQDGTVRVGNAIVAGQVSGRVRSMLSDKGLPTNEVGPGFPVEVMGLEMPPNAGDRFDVCADEETARSIAEQRRLEANKADQRSGKLSLEELFAKVKLGEVKEFPVILKADVAGSLEALKSLFEKIGNAEVRARIVHSAVGGISESDVLLAGTASGIVIGFNVRPDTASQRLAKEKGIEIRTYSIIYELMDDVKKAMGGLLKPEVVEKSMGRAEVRNLFVIPKVGAIAGCFIKDGKISRGNKVRLLRNGKIVYDGSLSSLKRFKDDVKEVLTGYECGIGIENFNDVKVGDEIEAYTQESVARDL